MTDRGTSTSPNASDTAQTAVEEHTDHAAETVESAGGASDQAVEASATGAANANANASVPAADAEGEADTEDEAAGDAECAAGWAEGAAALLDGEDRERIDRMIAYYLGSRLRPKEGRDKYCAPAAVTP